MKLQICLTQRVLPLIVLTALCIGSLFGLWRGISAERQYQVTPLTDADLSNLDLSHAEHLMIVAHPDDETLWGGGHIADGGYLIVCITNGQNKTRSAEFQSIMQATGNTGLILSYPDKVAGQRDDWSHVSKQIRQDLELVISYKSWKDIVTHNAAGEYGHIQHKMTHQFVTERYDQDALSTPLVEFGKYYRAGALPDAKKDLTPISEDALRQKEELLKLYDSQTSTVNALSHMNPFEMWNQIRGGTSDAQTTS